ncbi:MAG TPA: hypothetical protein QGF95_06545 [Candidatus Latescibacteria bacterium]|nr:hypothetical protein [Gemmatimonadaceae bacterium]MDP6018853.1 hypothetical protein [Candidatus Latescibacterota bacterium]HJP30195.1 hypothetical protein [Candidatus Latescibacterota bacterium]
MLRLVVRGAWIGALVAGLCVPATTWGQPGETGLGGGRAQLAGSAITPGFELDAVRPEMHKWYVPRHLPVTFDPTWYRNQSNYAVDAYRYYVSAELEGLVWYDQLGHPVERGWLLYEWQQEQEHPKGSSIWKGDEYNGLFRSLVVADEGGGGLEMRLMLGDQLETVFTPLTFVKPRFNGLRLDGANDYLQGSLILARPSMPNRDQIQSSALPSDRTDFVNLFGGHAEWTVAPRVAMGATYVNAHFGNTKETFGSGSPFGGALMTIQNQNLDAMWVRLRDDSPEDGVHGALLFDYDIVLVDTAGTELRGREIGFLPTVEGGSARGSALAADGSEAIVLAWNLEDLDADGVETEDLRRVRVELSVANDYHIEATSNMQTDGEMRRAAPVFLTVKRAAGNVQDNSNATVIAVDYGLPTATEVIGLDWSVTDWHGFSFQGELVTSRRHRQYPNPGIDSHHRVVERDLATYGQARYERHPWELYAEVFSIADGYDTGTWLMGSFGNIHYDDFTESRYEFVEDDDDFNGVPEWDRPLHGSNDVAWPGLDENADFLHDHNQNDNLIPDYEEPFLRFRSDRPEFLPGMDMNYNGTVDRFENDNLPDYPYRTDQRGVNTYGRAFLGPDLSLTVGRQRIAQISGDGRTDADYFLARWDFSTPSLRLRLLEHAAWVRDDIADPLRMWIQPFGSAGRMRDVGDPLSGDDAWLHSSYVDLEHRLGDAVRFEHRGRWQLMRQRDGDQAVLERELRRDSGFRGWIDRAEWRVPVGLSVLETRWKSEWREHRPPSRRLPSGTTLEQMAFIIWTQPLLAESASVAYFPRYGRQVFSTELQLGLELSRLWLLDGQLEDVEDDYRSWTTVAQLSNRSAYLGYQLVTRVGLQIGRKRFDDARSQRVSAFFLTVHAGLR